MVHMSLTVFFLVYRPPDSSHVYDYIGCSDYVSNVLSCLECNLNVKGPTIVVGDFNCPDINWVDFCAPSSHVSVQLYNFAVTNGFIQAVNKPTRGNNLVDLVLINQPFSLSALSVEPPFSSSDHNSVNFKVAANRFYPSNTELPKRTYLWKKGDYKAMCLYLNSYDWLKVLAVNFTPDDLWHAFCAILNEALDLYVPSVLLRNGNLNRKLWKYPSNIRILFSRKRCLWRHMKQNPNDVDLSANYKRLVYECRKAIKDYECTQEAKIIESQNAGTFYKYVNKKLYNFTAAPVLLDSKGSPVFADYDKAELFNSYFNSVNIADNGNLPDVPRRTKAETTLGSIEFSTKKIRNVIRKLKPKMTCDPEGYSSYLVKQLVSALPEPLMLLFNSFMSVGDIPSSWRKAIITPIYKKGPSSDPANYRPVSLTSVFGKIMERVIAADMIDYLLRNNLLNVSQHGFLSKRSTLTNLLESFDDWTISIENKFPNRVAYIDFSRAFDSVSHPKLLHKLKSYGIDGILLDWVANFLSGRSHCTKVGNVYSSFQCIYSGVVQGSCLGPLLFLVYINDVLDIFKSPVNCKLYADDVKLYTELKTAADESCFLRLFRPPLFVVSHLACS